MRAITRTPEEPMVKIVILVHRRHEMDASEFSRYWRETHSPIGAGLPGLRKYVQNHAIRAPDGTAPAYDGYAELWFDNIEAFEQALASPAGQAVMADAEKFIDLERMQTLAVDEVPIV